MTDHSVASTSAGDALTKGQLATAVSAVAHDYHRLVLLVGPSADGKSRALRGFAKAGAYPMLALGRSLAPSLLELSERQRQHRVATLVAQMVSDAAQGASVLVLDNIEVLFAPSLAVDPLRLLQTIARNVTTVAAWTGVYEGGALTYAAPSHPEHRLYHGADVAVVKHEADTGRTW